MTSEKSSTGKTPSMSLMLLIQLVDEPMLNLQKSNVLLGEDLFKFYIMLELLSTVSCFASISR